MPICVYLASDGIHFLVIEPCGESHLMDALQLAAWLKVNAPHEGQMR